jgi:hypothetical protein
MLQLADGRPLAFAALFLPVLGWVAFNIGAPALRQIDAMSDKAPAKKSGAKKRGIVAGLTGLTAAAMMAAPESAQAAQVRARGVPLCAWLPAHTRARAQPLETRGDIVSGLTRADQTTALSFPCARAGHCAAR